MRWIPLFLSAILIVTLVGGPRSASRTVLYSERIAVRSEPVTIQPSDPARTRVGALTLLAGWRLTSSSPQFGGWSALNIAGDQMTAIGDSGSVLRLRLGRFGHAADARIDPLPTGCGATEDKRDRDSESLAGGDRRSGGDWWVGFEWHNSICRVSHDFTHAVGLRAPPEMADWPKLSGPETMLRLADGRIMVLAERGASYRHPRPLLIYARDPVSPGARPIRLFYQAPPYTSPSDAAQLPDGRIVIINREFSVFTLFTAIITTIEPVQLRAGAIVHPRVIARLEPPVLSDNYEGLAVSEEHGKPVLWMISDDNFLSWQQTYLLKFAVDPR